MTESHKYYPYGASQHKGVKPVFPGTLSDGVKFQKILDGDMLAPAENRHHSIHVDTVLGFHVCRPRAGAGLPSVNSMPRLRCCCGATPALEINMSTGTVKWFNSTKGFGFIQPDDGTQDVFVHISAVERAGLGSLQEGQKVSFEVVRDPRRGKSSAESLRSI